MATKAQRHHMLEVMNFAAAHKSQLLYPPGDQRSSRDSTSWHLTEQQFEHLLNGGGKVQLDCSEWGSFVLKCGGCWHWSQPGWTGSHLDLLPRYTDGKIAGVGALVVVGMDYNRNGKHEAVVHTPDPKHGDPIVDGHGRPGYDRCRLSQLAVGDLAGHVFLNISHL